MKILTQTMALLLTVYLSLSFANQTITLEVDKANIENVAGIALYQNADTEPFVTLDATLPKPWAISADLVLINGTIKVHAIPVDINGIRGTKSPEFIYTIPDGSDITIKLYKD